MRQLFLCLLLTIFSIGAYSQKKNVNLQGAWKLVQVQQLENSSFVTVIPGKYTGEQVKIWSRNQVMFVGRYFTDSGTIEQYGHGTFKIDGNNSEEVLNIFSYKDWEGKPVKLRMEMKGDTLIQLFPLNEKYEVDKNTSNIEKYLRIK